jgi:hypothetical protein
LAKGHPNFKKCLHELLDKLADERALQLPIEQRPIWRSLQRTCNDAASYITDLEANNFEVSRWSRDIMGKDAFTQGFDIDSVDLVSATGTELTGKSEPTTREIFEGIRKAGGDLLPAWAGPELRKQYSDQPKGEVLIIAMEPITDSDGDPGVFGVNLSVNDRRLGTCWDRPDDRWIGGYRWVFARRK